MAKLVLGKSVQSDWFFFSRGFAVCTQAVYFCFGAKPANSKFATKTVKKKCEYCHSPSQNYQKKLKRLNFTEISKMDEEEEHSLSEFRIILNIWNF